MQLVFEILKVLCVGVFLSALIYTSQQISKQKGLLLNHNWKFYHGIVWTLMGLAILFLGLFMSRPFEPNYKTGGGIGVALPDEDFKRPTIEEIKAVEEEFQKEELAQEKQVKQENLEAMKESIKIFRATKNE